MKPYYRILRVGHSRVTPCKVYTLKEAEAEALRLAGVEPGETFEILKVLGLARTTEPSIFWNDGVEPPSPGKGQEGWDPSPAPTAEPSYRMLEAGERIEEGDEFLVAGSNNQWLKRQLNLGQPWYPELYAATRRPINKKP